MTGLRIVRTVTWAAVAALVIAVGVLAWQWQQGGSPIAAAAVGGPFQLTDQHGATVTDATLQGHPSAMFFGYTFCPDVCPTTLSDLTLLMEKLGPAADKLQVYFVTVDPERDTAEQLGAYLQAFDPRFLGLTGSRPAIDQMLKAYRVYSRRVPLEGGSYTMDHTASVYLLDSRGRLTGTLDYHEPEETALAKLKRLIEGA
ncbi:MAG: SCO family protein [Bauldia sp.]